MATYKVTDPTSGKTMTLTGDSPPTEAELNAVFAKVGAIANKQNTTEAIPQWGVNNPRLYGAARTAYDVLAPTAEAIGMVGGGIIGGTAATPETLGLGTIPGAIAGAGLGYAGAKRATKAAAIALGIENPETFSQAFSNTGKDIGEGAAYEVGGQGVGKVVGGVISTIAREGAKTKAAAETLKAAKALNYELTPAEATGQKGLSLFEKALSYLPGSASTMNNKALAQLEKLTALREELISQVNNGKGVPQSVESVGNKIKAIVDKYVGVKQGAADAATLKLANDTLTRIGSKDTYESLQADFKTAIEQRSQIAAAQKRAIYQDVGKYVPEGDYALPETTTVAEKLLVKEQNAVNPDSTVIRVLKNILRQDETPIAPEAQQVIDSVKNYPEKVRTQILESEGIAPPETGGYQPRNWSNLQDIRTQLNDLIKQENAAYGKNAPGFAGQATRESPVYNQLKKALDSDMQDIAKNSGSEAYDRLMAANKWFSEEYAPTWKNDKTIQKLVYSNPQAVIDTVFTNRTSVADVDKLIKAVGREKYLELQKGFINRLFEKAQQSGEPGKIWESIFKQSAQYGREPLAAIFSKNPEDLKTLLQMTMKGMNGARLPVADKFFTDVLKRSTPDTLMNLIFHKNNAENIKLLEGILPKELMNEAKANFIADKILVASKDFGLYRPQMSATQRGKLDPATYDAIVPKDVQKFMDHIMTLSRGAERIEKLAGNPSGTAQSLITYEVGMGIIMGGWDVAAGTVTGDWKRVGRGGMKAAGMVLGPKALAKIYLSPAGRKLLVEGFKTPIGTPQAAAIGTRLAIIGGKENMTPEEVQQ